MIATKDGSRKQTGKSGLCLALTYRRKTNRILGVILEYDGYAKENQMSGVVAV
jgi:hypothetical protein